MQVVMKLGRQESRKVARKEGKQKGSQVGKQEGRQVVRETLDKLLFPPSNISLTGVNPVEIRWGFPLTQGSIYQISCIPQSWIVCSHRAPYIRYPAYQSWIVFSPCCSICNNLQIYTVYAKKLPWGMLLVEDATRFKIVHLRRYVGVVVVFMDKVSAQSTTKLTRK